MWRLGSKMVMELMSSGAWNIERSGCSFYGEVQVLECHLMWHLLRCVKPRSVAVSSQKKKGCAVDDDW
jgi:hypothetical protein